LRALEARAPVDAGEAQTLIRLYTQSLDTKRDNSALNVDVPTETNRTAQGATVNPAAAVIATLDCRGLTNKSFAVTDTAVGTYDLETSYDGTTYRTVTAGTATIVGTVFITALQADILRGFRFFRIRATQAAGTVTAELSAMGA
jgi:hypothetical protein